MGKLNNMGMLDERKDFIVCNSQMKDKKIKCFSCNDDYNKYITCYIYLKEIM